MFSRIRAFKAALLPVDDVTAKFFAAHVFKIQYVETVHFQHFYLPHYYQNEHNLLELTAVPSDTKKYSRGLTALNEL